MTAMAAVQISIQDEAITVVASYTIHRGSQVGATVLAGHHVVIW